MKQMNTSFSLTFIGLSIFFPSFPSLSWYFLSAMQQKEKEAYYHATNTPPTRVRYTQLCNPSIQHPGKDFLPKCMYVCMYVWGCTDNVRDTHILFRSAGGSRNSNNSIWKKRPHRTHTLDEECKINQRFIGSRCESMFQGGVKSHPLLAFVGGLARSSRGKRFAACKMKMFAWLHHHLHHGQRRGYPPVSLLLPYCVCQQPAY